MCPLTNQKETLESNQDALVSLLEGEMSTNVGTRLSMKTFVDKWFFMRDYSYDDRLWYERLFSFEKFVVLLMTLESLNLKAMGATPTVEDIPQSLAWFGHLVTNARADWENIKAKHKTTHLKICSASLFTKFYSKGCAP